MHPSPKYLFEFFLLNTKFLDSKPPLASSLQTFETTLYLISSGRYESALVSCFSAIESGLKAHFNIPADNRETEGYKLLRIVGKKSHALSNNMFPGIDRLRKKRNSIIHYGFSPKDDTECASLLLETGLPYIIKLYSILFRIAFNAKDRSEKKHDPATYEVVADQMELRFPISQRLLAATHAFQEDKNRNLDIDPCSYFSILQKYLQTEIKYNQQSLASFESTNLGHRSERNWRNSETGKIEFEVTYHGIGELDMDHNVSLRVSEIESRLEKLNKIYTKIKCPGCECDDTFVLVWDQIEYDQRKLHPIGGYCPNCDLEIKTPGSLLENQLNPLLISKKEEFLNKWA